MSIPTAHGTLLVIHDAIWALRIIKTIKPCSLIKIFWKGANMKFWGLQFYLVAVSACDCVYRFGKQEYCKEFENSLKYVSTTRFPNTHFVLWGIMFVIYPTFITYRKYTRTELFFTVILFCQT